MITTIIILTIIATTIRIIIITEMGKLLVSN